MKNRIVDAAREALTRSYAPYSGYPVGAAVLAQGRIYTGANIENASYGLTICAERVAAAKAVDDGARVFEAVAVAVLQGKASPCGACRQFLREFGENFPVYLVSGDGSVSENSLDELLPLSFGPAFLRAEDE